MMVRLRMVALFDKEALSVLGNALNRADGPPVNLTAEQAMEHNHRLFCLLVYDHVS